MEDRKERGKDKQEQKESDSYGTQKEDKGKDKKLQKERD